MLEQPTNNPEDNSLENNPEEKEGELQKELHNPAIRDQLKRITIFGGFDEPKEDESTKLNELGELIADEDITTIIGGNYGYLKSVSEGVVENNGKVIVASTTEGKKKGFETENIKGKLRGAYYEGGYSAKKQGLFHESVGAYIVLPSDTLGAYTEMVEAVDKNNSFDVYVDNFPQPIIFIGDFWKDKFENDIKPRIGEETLEHIYFVDEDELDEVPMILSRYAKEKAEHEQGK